jgi:5-methylthioadenosine/S-adenosylhomocysteine deaminase
MSTEKPNAQPVSTTQTPVDLLISAQWIALVDTENTLLEHHSIAVDNGVIVGIIPSDVAQHHYSAAENVDLPNQLLIPGLINAHGHSAMTLFRGFADDLPLMTWLQDHMWPAESTYVAHDFVHDSSQLALVEMIKSGTTCFADMYFFPEATITAANNAGIRAYIAPPVFDFPSNWQQSADGYISAIVELADTHQDSPLTTVAFGPHAPYTVGNVTFEAILAANEAIDLGMHIHVHETQFEIEESLKNFGTRPLKRLQDLGVLSPKTQCVHMTQVSDEDIDILQATGASVIHCPRSNMKLASGLSPIQKLRELGIQTGLGTDSAASNNCLNMINEMTQAALLAKVTSMNAEALSSEQALRIATIDSAKALGLDKKIGSLEVGKQADIAAVDLSNITQQPVYSPLSALIYSDSSKNVSNVWVNGKRLLNNGLLTTIDDTEVLRNSQQWQKKLKKQ